MSSANDQIALLLNLTRAERFGAVASFAYTGPNGELDQEKASRELALSWQKFRASMATDADKPDRAALQQVIATATAMLAALGVESENDGGGEEEDGQAAGAKADPYFNKPAPTLPQAERFQFEGNSSSSEGMVIYRR